MTDIDKPWISGVDFAYGRDGTVYWRQHADGTIEVIPPEQLYAWCTPDQLVSWSERNDPRRFETSYSYRAGEETISYGVNDGVSGIVHIDNVWFIESPLLEKPEMFIPGNTKRGRQLNSHKVKRGSRRYDTRVIGGKELERGARSYMVTHYPNGQKIPGHGIMCTMSKKQFDRDVEYILE